MNEDNDNNEPEEEPIYQIKEFVLPPINCSKFGNTECSTYKQCTWRNKSDGRTATCVPRPNQKTKTIPLETWLEREGDGRFAWIEESKRKINPRTGKFSYDRRILDVRLLPDLLKELEITGPSLSEEERKVVEAEIDKETARIQYILRQKRPALEEEEEEEEEGEESVGYPFFESSSSTVDMPAEGFEELELSVPSEESSLEEELDEDDIDFENYLSGEEEELPF